VKFKKSAYNNACKREGDSKVVGNMWEREVQDYVIKSISSGALAHVSEGQNEEYKCYFDMENSETIVFDVSLNEKAIVVFHVGPGG
jgi:Tfp pilus assembly ATPase PilU